MTETIYSGLKQLGGATLLPESPDKAELERVRNPQADVATTCASPRPSSPRFAR